MARTHHHAGAIEPVDSLGLWPAGRCLLMHTSQPEYWGRQCPQKPPYCQATGVGDSQHCLQNS
eukprot:1470213-Amphidinium_carterae.1